MAKKITTPIRTKNITHTTHTNNTNHNMYEQQCIPGCEDVKEAVNADVLNDEDKINIRRNNTVIAHQVRNALTYLRGLNLSKESERSMQTFLTFHYQARNLLDYYKDRQVPCNLLIQAEDLEQGMDFSTALKTMFNIKTMVEIKESDYVDLNEFDDSAVDRGNIIVITGCRGKIMDNANLHDSTQRSQHQRKIDRYNFFWDIIKAAIKEFPSKMFVIIAPETVCKYTFESDKELYDECVSNHIVLEPYTEKQVFDMVLNELSNAGFGMEQGFVARLREYVHNDFRIPRKLGSNYARLLAKDINRRFFSTRVVNYRLDERHVPELKQDMKSPEDIFAEMKKLIGMGCIKDELMKIYRAYANMKKYNCLSAVRSPLHMILTGNPGTGKTTAAKMLADMLYSMGVISTNKCIVASAHDCTSIYKHGNVDKLAALIDNAMDGVLFIDEAYALASDKNPNQDAIALLLEAAEDRAEHLVIVLAGYKEQMTEFMNINPGIKHRFPRMIDFPDYSISELMQIFDSMCEQEQVTLEKSARALLEEHLLGLKVQKDFANARTVRNVYGQLSGAADWQEDGTRVIKKSHVKAIMPEHKAQTLNNLVGLKTVKAKIRELSNTAAYIKTLQEQGKGANVPMNLSMVLTGNPGTGKSTVAKLLSNDLYGVKVLKSNNCLCLERKDLVSGVIGETEKKTAAALSQGYGGVIFIDEAYSLTNGTTNDVGNKVIEVLLTAMIEHRDDTAFVFAGYPAEMRQFLDANPGLSSRIGYHFEFEDYSVDELAQMFANLCKSNGLVLRARALEQFKEVAEFFRPMPHFGNGRFVDQVFQQTITKRSCRSFTKGVNVITRADIPTIEDMNDIFKGTGESYNPSEIDEAERKRTAYHELGHAVAALAAGRVPEDITITNQIDSLGHVTLPKMSGNLTEQQCKDLLVMYLSGRNAERMLLGDASTGCSSDYNMAKRLAGNMVRKYAMGQIGVTKPMDFIIEADKNSVDLLAAYKDFIERTATLLLDKKSITGDELKAAFDTEPIGESVGTGKEAPLLSPVA